MPDNDDDALRSLSPDRRERVEGALAEARRGRRSRALWAAVVAVCAVVLMAVTFTMADRGRAIPSDGVLAVARVERAPDGSCVVGERHSHCYGLELTVFPSDRAPYAAKVDVNVPDRWASRIQPGAFVRVVGDKTEPARVYLDIEAFAAPAPLPPANLAADASHNLLR